MSSSLSAAEWIRRCSERLVQVDSQLAEGEARELARELHRFERTCAMPPESAADFVAEEIARGNPRFERRSAPRE